MNAQNAMDAKKQSDRDKIDRILISLCKEIIRRDEAIDQIFKLFTPKQYRPFTPEDFADFWVTKVRRKGEMFKDEIWLVEGCTKDDIYITTQTGEDEFSSEWKSFQTMFDEWEFSNGECFGKLI